MNLHISNKQAAIVASVAVVSVLLAIVVCVCFYIKRKKDMKISVKGLDLLKRLEGLRLTAYKCSAGVWTIGYGHTNGVKEGDSCSQAQAEEWLREDVEDAEDTVNWQGLNINQNQFDALVCFCYNVGASAFKKSTLLKKVKANPNDESIAAEFAKWKYAGGKVVEGLVNRRSGESNLYFA